MATQLPFDPYAEQSQTGDDSFDVYEAPNPVGYAQAAVPNNTLTTLLGAENGNFQEVHNSILTSSAAFVAAQAANKERLEEVDLLKSAAMSRAGLGRTAEVEQALVDIQNIQAQKDESFVDDVNAVARATIERIAIQNKKTVPEVISLLQQHADNLSTRGAFEAVIQSMEQRGGVAQFAQDVLGLQTAEDWFRLSPTVNQELEKLGYQGSRSVTGVSAGNSLLEVLQKIPAADRGKIIYNLAEKLKSVVGEKDTRRFLEYVAKGDQEDQTLEAIFGTLDIVGIGQLLGGAAKAVIRGSSALKVARDLGMQDVVAKDLANQIADNTSVLGATTKGAVDAAIPSTFLPREAASGLSSSIMRDLEARVAATLKSVENSIYSGTATRAEVGATLERLQRNYSVERNPNIIESKVVPNYDGKNLDIDVLYGTSQGKLFDTAEEGLSYYGARKSGTLEAVPIAGTKEEVQAAIKEVDQQITTLRKEVGVTEDVTSPASVKLEEVVAERIRLQDQLDNPIKGFAIRQKMNMPVFADDIGRITTGELDSLHVLLGKLNPRLSAATSIFSSSLASMYKGSKHSKLYGDFMAKSFDKVNNKTKAVVDKAIRKSDKLKRDLTPLELSIEGVESTEGLEAYYAYRTMRNIQHFQKTKEMDRDLVAKGFKDVTVRIDEVESIRGPGKVVELEDIKLQEVYDIEKKVFTRVTKEAIEQWNRRGVVAVEYKQAQTIKGVSGEVNKVIAPVNSSIIGDIKNSVGYVAGSYSRIHTEEFWIKLRGLSTVNGEQKEISKAFRTALSQRDAEKYVEGFKRLAAQRAAVQVITPDDVAKQLGNFEQEADKLASQFNDGVFDGFELGWNYTRLDDNYIRNTIGTGGGDKTEGALFWSKRGEEGIKSITNGSIDSETLGPLESLQAEITNTSNFTATNEWRRNAVRRWYNTFEDVFPANMRTGNAEEVFFRNTNTLRETVSKDKKTAQMFATRDFILNQLGVLTADERAIRSFVNKITSPTLSDTKLFGKYDVSKLPALSHVGAYIRQADTINWVKSVSSTFMLGAFSSAQLVVQASGMLMTASMHPVHGVRAAFAIKPILTALTSDNPSVWKKVFGWSDKKKMAMDESEFGKVAAATRKVGLLDNIGASSLYNAQDGALNIYSKWNRKWNEKQMMFFNTGEEINRVGAFEVARRLWIDANPGKAWDADEALQEILLKSDDMTQNMTKTSEARYQKGVFGIPFQFLQYNIKFGANAASGMRSMLTGKKPQALSAKEVFAMTLGSYALYGYSNNATPDILEDWLGEQFNSTLSPTTKQYLTQGIVAGALSTIGETLTGQRTDIALGARLAPLQWYEDLYDAIASTSSANVLQALSGPTGSTIVNLLEVGEIFSGFLKQDQIEVNEFLRTISTAGATIASSWRNMDKAYWAMQADGMIYNKRGDPTARLSATEIVFQGIGLQSTEAHESNSVFKTKQDYNNAMKNYADTYMRYSTAARKAFLAGDIEGMRTNDRAAQAVVSVLPEADRQAIEGMVKQNTTYDTVGREAFNKWATEFSSRKSRILVTNPYGETDGD